MNEELKPCPFCGSPEPRVTWSNLGKGHRSYFYWSIVCDVCGGNVSIPIMTRPRDDSDPIIPNDGAKIVQERWNRRVME